MSAEKKQVDAYFAKLMREARRNSDGMVWVEKRQVLRLKKLALLYLNHQLDQSTAAADCEGLSVADRMEYLATHQRILKERNALARWKP